jgi:hypothetical protein
MDTGNMFISVKSSQAISHVNVGLKTNVTVNIDLDDGDRDSL